MKLITWNVNGYRAMKKKGLETLLDLFDADIVCLQEIKATADQIDLPEELYPYLYVNAADRKGYSGTLIASRYQAQEVIFGLGQEKLDHEGRIITCVFENFTLVNVYTPNSQQNLKRIDFRLEWDQAFLKHVLSLKEPVLICGDLNVARGSLDIWDEGDGVNQAGYSKLERDSLEQGLLRHFVDTFRFLYPQERTYSWWSYYTRGRERNRGWRIDYWLASPSLLDKIQDVRILTDVYGSDHCPVELQIDLDTTPLHP